MEILIETIQRNLPGGARHTGKCTEMNCPCCVMMGESRPDTRGRGGLFVEPTTIGYNCFNCGFKFRQNHDAPLGKKPKIFLEALGVSRDEIQKIIFTFRKNMSEDKVLLNQLFRPTRKASADLEFKPDQLPLGSRLLIDVMNEITDETHPAFQVYTYAYERGIENNTTLVWTPSTENKMNEYLIIPFLYDEKIVGWQARYTGNDPWIIRHKRFINSNPNSGKYLFGIENVFSDKKFLIINESLIDSYLYQGVGLMSHNISINQINIINQFSGTKILVPDFGKGGVDLTSVAIEHGWSVYFPFWDDGRDLGKATDEYGRIFLLNDMIKNSVSSPSSIRLRRKHLLRNT